MHEPTMDRSKPLWEFHLIDGIKGGQFAVYLKLHHAYADGITMTSWLQDSLGKSAQDMKLTPVWTTKRPQGASAKAQVKDSLLTRTIRGVQAQARDLVLTTGGIAKLSAQQYLERIGITRNAVSLQFNARGNTPLTGSVSPGRSLATANLSMKEIRRICDATRSTVNHVALSCIDGALHRYLEESGFPIDHPISIQMPVSLRKSEDEDASNKLGIVLVDLAQPTQDPYLRLREIGLALRKVRNQIDNVPGSALEQYSLLTALAGEVVDKLRLSDRLPANGHTLVSNVPGPREPLYIKGAKVAHIYPISTLPPGLHTNITLFSYSGILNIGIVATQDVQELATLGRYIEDEFSRLQEAVHAPV
jgi:WS/DGAT/MGAT family acyltransferase